MKKIAKINIFNDLQNIWQVVIFASVASFLSYLYIVGSITFNVIERKNIENEIKNSNSQLSQLELEYLSLDREINLDLAWTLGFIENSNTFFAERKVFVVNQ
ncbi:MAG TPA: hypothetical protein VJ103_01090 [Candidatus Paceibacterota bacterium]|nr:hypothetical protein [Candidatus Paceibacterota bacterium]